MLVFGGAKGCSDEDFVSGGASVGRSAPLHPLGDGMREGCDPLALSRGWFGGNFGFRRCRNRLRWRCRFSMTQRAIRMRFHFRRCRKRLRWRCWFSAARRAVRMRIWFPTARAWGAPLPYTPSGDGMREGCDPLALSRGWFGGNLDFRRCRKRLRWRCRFSAAQRDVRMRIWFPTAWAWGALLPYTPSGDGVREGCDPLALSRGWFGGNLDFRRCRKQLRWRCWFSAARRAVRMRISFPAARAWGAPLPYTPSGGRGARGLRPSRALPGLGWREFGFPTVQRRFSGGGVVFSSKWERLPASAETGFGRF